MKKTIFLLVLSVCAAFAAGVAGEWDATASFPNGKEYRVVISLRESDGKLEGTVADDRGSVGLEDLKLEGTELSFKATEGNGTFDVKLTVSADSMKGSVKDPAGKMGTLVAVRPKS